MKRSEFIRHGLALGFGLPFLSLLESCKKEVQTGVPQFEINFSGKVIIVGAGAAGLTAAYLLHRNNIDFEILEASAHIGGRVKRTDTFADFPIDLGAEWIHARPSILAEIIRNPDVNASMEFITYNPQTVYTWKDNKLKKSNWMNNFYSEHKFKRDTWHGFFEKYIYGDFKNKISLNKAVSEVDYSQNQITLKTEDNSSYTADKIVITTPVKILQDGLISFSPGLPESKIAAINSITMGAGIKVFMEFKEKFYPDILSFSSLISDDRDGERIYYNAAFRKDAQKNILGLFTVGKNAEQYAQLNTDQEIIDKILAELDEVFDGKASQNYIKHVIQNWSKEPYIRGSYSSDFSNDRTRTMEDLMAPVEKKVYFAGEALSDENQATVHGASETAYTAIEALLKN